ncbi:MMPL family transporter [Actinoalloteichus hymeniacidonis]|uniref:RND superfamily drug exporter n=1 Tax=Actinoalloteichus hymeniacidonis TaxID=340345 RepID=A0AAC9N0P4_9PSEU|nr:MMPL family transporter [Actinoalloteichus hymeniacidonis]AOS65610.1 putative RND superfamily drug exporter [Actinoalloteichus hymeniacidonis]MBB5906300.1 RND superfamily putative drug exporter [Actinoalloteichus hymeniacidonis]
MFRLLTRLATARPRLLLFCTLLFLVDAMILGGGVVDRLRGEGLSDPASESAQAEELLQEHFPGTQSNFIVLVEADREVNDRQIAREGTEVVTRLAAEDSVSDVNSYWTGAAEDMRSPDGRYALIVAHIEGTPEDARDVYDTIAPEYQGVEGELTLRVGGELAIQAEMETTIGEDLLRAELIALPVVFILLVLVFGSAVAALLPLVVGIVSILGTNAALSIIAGFTDVSVFAQNLTTALGLGLAIDYALLMVRRHRDELGKGRTPHEAVVRTLNTAGRTVAFSALVIGVSLASMVIFPQYFLRSFAYAGIPVVLLAALSALIVLPALLLVLGKRIDALDLRRLFRRGAPTGPAVAAPEQGRWYRMTTAVIGRAPVFVIGSVVFLLALGVPFLNAEFGTADHRQLPDSAGPRVVSEVLESQFDSSVTGTIHIAAQDAEPEDLADYATRLSTLDNVDEVLTPVGVFAGGEQTQQPTIIDSLQQDGDVSLIGVVPVPEVENISPETMALVRAIHDTQASFETGVAGQVATLVDSQAAIGERLVIAAAIILAVTLVLLFLLTGGILVSLLAVVSNALSLAAMFGAVVWVFGQGNLSGLFGFEVTGYIDTFLPVLMFCLAFGLSMDYGVFLLARIKEEYDRTGDHRGSIALGVQRTGGIITAAAIILAVVLIAVGSSRITNSMMLGWGAALAVLVDATVVRCLLFPAALSLAGPRAWWAPAPLRRLQRRFALHEGGPDEDVDPPPPPPTGSAGTSEVSPAIDSVDRRAAAPPDPVGALTSNTSGGSATDSTPSKGTTES